MIRLGGSYSRQPPVFGLVLVLHMLMSSTAGAANPPGIGAIGDLPNQLNKPGIDLFANCSEVIKKLPTKMTATAGVQALIFPFFAIGTRGGLQIEQHPGAGSVDFRVAFSGAFGGTLGASYPFGGQFLLGNSEVDLSKVQTQTLTWTLYASLFCGGPLNLTSADPFGAPDTIGIGPTFGVGVEVLGEAVLGQCTVRKQSGKLQPPECVTK